MIQLGRYDVFAKWEIICRHWAGNGGTPPDVGLDRHSRPLFAQWELIAYSGGVRYCHDFIRLKYAALNADEEEADKSPLNEELFRWLQEIGISGFDARSARLFQSVRASGIEALSDEMSKPIADRLKEIFKFGALRALRWTEDIGEIPSVNELRYAARTAFPAKSVKGKRNVLAIFCAREYGVNDIIHIYDICPDQVTLVDREKECLDVLNKIYPPEWTYVCADYKDFLREAEEHNLTYDLVVTDPYEAMAPEIAFEMFPAIAARSTDMIVLHYTNAMFDDLGVDPDDLEGLSAAIRRRTGVAVVALERGQRSRVNCWILLRKGTGS